ncbi:hypothetical protein [Streptomyces lasiicapitis]|uniref:Uncharacterized protein n=1 Tax=Streptomyces lasiicapitis TaxID=1923961 RepID=A0ABQ2MV11_9ACTN|nr:hypothetical protein [Streptomyces lasiicapitis]GGO58847.1 hypothetical protein GCM10012286_79080 [Streptomyces lasiicapitis]
MPFSQDKMRLATCRELLNLPDRDLRVIRRPSGRIVLDIAHAGQQAFQAMLFDCFFSPVREHPFDRSRGRSFADLETYFNSVSPRTDRLVIRTNTAARVALYLLPTVREFADGTIELAGLPGVRLADLGKRRLLLHHLPTGGQVELLDTRSGLDVNDVDLLMGDRAIDTDDHQPAIWIHRLVWRERGLTPSEATAAPHWATTAHTSLHSALMTRLHLWPGGYNRRASTAPARRANARHCLTWRYGRATDDIARLLTHSPVAIPGAVYTPSSTCGRDRALLRLNGAAIELDGPLPDEAARHE